MHEYHLQILNFFVREDVHSEKSEQRSTQSHVFKIETHCS